VGHHQSFAFCLAHWGRPCDQFMRQQTPTSFSGTCSQHHHTTTTATFLHMLPLTKQGREHRRARRREKGGCTRYACYIFLLISISYGFPLPAQPSLSWGMSHPPNYATPSRRTRKTRHLQRVFHFRRLFFGGYLAPSPSRQHPLPVSPSPSHLLWYLAPCTPSYSLKNVPP